MLKVETIDEIIRKEIIWQTPQISKRCYLPVLTKNTKEVIDKKIRLQLPKFMVIGVAKSGTTSLCENLNQHPILFLSNVKEPRFFSGGKYQVGIEWYIDLWKDAPLNAIKFEGTTLYSFVPCQERIKALIPDIKLIIMLRDPVKRAWSHYYPHFAQSPHFQAATVLTDPGSEVVQRGIYIDQIKAWHSHFPKENLLIIHSEEYFKNEIPILQAIYNFLQVENIPPTTLLKIDPWAETKKIVGYPPIPIEIEDWLKNFYKPHNEELETYLNRKFNWG